MARESDDGDSRHLRYCAHERQRHLLLPAAQRVQHVLHHHHSDGARWGAEAGPRAARTAPLAPLTAVAFQP